MRRLTTSRRGAAVLASVAGCLAGVCAPRDTLTTAAGSVAQWIGGLLPREPKARNEAPTTKKPVSNDVNHGGHI
jgi:hypothetical protein